MKLIALLFIVSIVAATGAAQWTRATGPSSARIGGLAADSVGHVYAAGDSQWYRSANNGDTWTSMPLTTPEWSGGRFCVGRGGKIFAGTENGISRSITFGESWEDAAMADTGVTAMYVGPDGTVYAGTAPLLPHNTWRAGVSRSSDDGASWVQCAPFWEPSTVEAIAMTPQGTMFVAQISHISISGSIMRTTNAGVHWDTVCQCANENIVALAVGPDGTIFAGTMSMMGPGGRALRSTDNGESWTQVQTGEQVWSFVFTGPGHVFLSTTSVYGSTDNGTTWRWAGPGLPQAQVLSLARNRNTLFAGVAYDGVWRIPLIEVTGVEEPGAPPPAQFVLSQNYPNPFNPTTTIRYGVSRRSNVTLTLHNILGQQVAVLTHGEQEAGYHEVRFDGTNLASGVYFYRLQAGTNVAAKRLLLIR